MGPTTIRCPPKRHHFRVRILPVLSYIAGLCVPPLGLAHAERDEHCRLLRLPGRPVPQHCLVESHRDWLWPRLPSLEGMRLVELAAGPSIPRTFGGRCWNCMSLRAWAPPPRAGFSKQTMGPKMGFASSGSPPALALHPPVHDFLARAVVAAADALRSELQPVARQALQRAAEAALCRRWVSTGMIQRSSGLLCNLFWADSAMDQEQVMRWKELMGCLSPQWAITAIRMPPHLRTISTRLREGTRTTCVLGCTADDHLSH